ncbi:MAG: Psychrobacter phage pOW20-A [Pseudomonadota bacterium]|jgi:hypothetical protein
MARPTIQLEDIEFNGWDQLDALIVWASQVYCAEKLGISIETLATKIKDRTGLSFPEYKYQKKESLRINLLKKQYDVAMAGNVSMLIWLGKNELGQKDKLETDMTVSELKILISKEESEL